MEVRIRQIELKIVFGHREAGRVTPPSFRLRARQHPVSDTELGGIFALDGGSNPGHVQIMKAILQKAQGNYPANAGITIIVDTETNVITDVVD